MTKIKLNWKYAQGELDTDTLKLICLPARGKRAFGRDELDAAHDDGYSADEYDDGDSDEW